MSPVGRLYDHVAVVAPGLALDRRRALAAAARSRGATTSVDGAIREARARLAGLAEPVPGLADARRRVARREADLEARRERVATLRGRTRESDDEAVLRSFRAAVGELSEAELEYQAAREALAERRAQARRVRDDREHRLRLEDRLGNLERTARRELVGEVQSVVDDAVAALPGGQAGSFDEADVVPAALALVRAGRVRTPVVLACRRFPDRATAESWLGAPVIPV